MHSRAPQNYICPICLGNQGIENEHTLLKQKDLVFNDELVSVWINSFWMKGNEGHAIVVPNQHFENLYSIPAEIGGMIFEISQMMSKAMKKAYSCDGITLRQNNEPVGDQHAFHYHLHIFPRYEGDNFNEESAKGGQLSEAQDRAEYAEKLKPYI